MKFAAVTTALLAFAALVSFGEAARARRFAPPGVPPPPWLRLPPRPPPGFELVLSPTVYTQLLAVHENSALTIDEQKRKIDEIMKASRVASAARRRAH